VSEEPFAKVPTRVARDVRLSLAARTAYAVIASYDWTEAGMLGGLKTLAADLGVSVRTARRAVAELKGAGLIDVQRRGKGKTCRMMCARPATTGHSSSHDRPPQAGIDRPPVAAQEKKRGEKKEPPNPPSQGGTVKFSDRDRKIVSKAWAVPGMYGDTRIAWRALDEAGRSEDKLKAAFAWWADNPGTQLPGKVVA